MSDFVMRTDIYLDTAGELTEHLFDLVRFFWLLKDLSGEKKTIQECSLELRHSKEFLSDRVINSVGSILSSC